MTGGELSELLGKHYPDATYNHRRLAGEYVRIRDNFMGGYLIYFRVEDRDIVQEFDVGIAQEEDGALRFVWMLSKTIERLLEKERRRQ